MYMTAAKAPTEIKALKFENGIASYQTYSLIWHCFITRHDLRTKIAAHPIPDIDSFYYWARQQVLKFIYPGLTEDERETMFVLQFNDTPWYLCVEGILEIEAE